MTHLYLAGVGKYGEALLGLDNLRFLVSYFYLRNEKSNDWYDVNLALRNKIPLMLDSGAWSAMTRNETLDNQEYIRFCMKHGNKFEVIVSLDVIGDWQTTKKNHEEMKQAGISSLTTFHLGSPFEELNRLFHTESYLGIGGLATRGNRIISQKWIKYINTKRSSCRFHGFGVTTPELLKLYDWHSVDGTTWMTAAIRYGRIMYHHQGNIKWIQVSNQKELEANWHLIGEGIRKGWDLVNGRTKNYEYVALRYNAKSLLELVKYCSENKKEDLQGFLL